MLEGVSNDREIACCARCAAPFNLRAVSFRCYKPPAAGHSYGRATKEIYRTSLFNCLGYIVGPEGVPVQSMEDG